MAYDERLAERIRGVLASEDDVVERRMMGGLAFLVAGHMTVTASGRGGLMVRVEPAEAQRLLGEPGVGPMVMRGREMRGWLRVQPDAVATAPALRAWVDRGLRVVRALPPKD